MAKTVLRAIGKVATECIRRPGQPSLWLEAEGRYVCPDEANAYALAERSHEKPTAPSARLDPKFKLVFLTATGGTVLLHADLCRIAFGYNGRTSARAEGVH